MFKKLFFFVCILAVSIQAQWTYTSTIAAGDSAGAPIKLAKGELPVAVYTADSLFNNTGAGTTDTTKILDYYIVFGDTAGYDTLGLSMAYKVSAVDDGSTKHTTTFLRKIYTSLTSTVFYSLLANPYLQSSGNNTGVIYFIPVVENAVKKAVSVKVKTRNY